MKAYIGIDPGLRGGIAIIHGDIETAFAMPLCNGEIDTGGILEALGEFVGTSVHVVIEKVHAMPKQGVSSTFTFGKGYGKVIACVETLRLPHSFVEPRVWTKEMHAGVKSGNPKERSLIAATQLFPNTNFNGFPPKKKPQDGLVDAILLAEYGRRKNL